MEIDDFKSIDSESESDEESDDPEDDETELESGKSKQGKSCDHRLSVCKSFLLTKIDH